MSALDAINLGGAILGFIAIGVLIWFASRGDPEREAEEAARLYFDTHGRWPDEPAASRSRSRSVRVRGDTPSTAWRNSLKRVAPELHAQSSVIA